MSEEIRRSIQAVEQAMESLNQAFERHAETLRQTGPSKELTQWTMAQSAMQDSGNIYLSWAQHYARTAAGETLAGTDDAEALEDFLDEGSGLSEQDRPLR